MMASVLHWKVTNDVKTQYKGVYNGVVWTGTDCQQLTLTLVDG